MTAVPALRIEVPIPRLLKHQVPIGVSPARFIALHAGRRFGKDRLALNVSMVGRGPKTCQGCARAPHPKTEPCYRGLSQGFDVVWLAPDFSQANLIWVEEILPRFQDVEGVRLDRDQHTLNLPGRGTLWVRSAVNADAVRGVGKRLGGVIVNEAAHMDLEYVWRSVVRPALMDNQGWALIMSTTNSGLDGNAERKTPSFFNRLCQEIYDGKRGKRGAEWEVFHGTARDNPKIRPSEFDALVAEYEPDSKQLQEEVHAKLLAGGSGLAFPEWDESLHVLPAAFNPPPHWRWGGALDFGYTANGWFGMFAFGTEGEVYGIDEFYFRQLHAREVGRRIGRLTQLVPEFGVIAADSAMWAKTGLGPTVAEEVQSGIKEAYRGTGRGVPGLVEATKGPGSRHARKQLFHRYLFARRARDGSVPLWGQPRLKFRETCKHAIRTIPQLPIDPRDPEDVDTTAEDHPYDGTGYLLMSRPPLAPLPAEPRDEHTHPGFDYEAGVRRDPSRDDAPRPRYFPHTGTQLVPIPDL